MGTECSCLAASAEKAGKGTLGGQCPHSTCHEATERPTADHVLLPFIPGELGLVAKFPPPGRSPGEVVDRDLSRLGGGFLPAIAHSLSD